MFYLLFLLKVTKKSFALMSKTIHGLKLTSAMVNCVIQLRGQSVSPDELMVM